MASRQYADWLMAQSSERQAEALAHLDVCERLGEAQRTAPRSQEAQSLTAEIRAYYARNGI